MSLVLLQPLQDNTMDTEKYSKGMHGQILDRWFEARGLTSVIDTLPECGFVALSEGEFVAASFLRRVEGGYCLFDGLVTNPILPPFKRHLGIEAVVKELILEAKRLKMHKILAYSLDTGTIKRSMYHGFKKLAHTLIMLDLD